jgi:hypothetical protein
MNKVLDSPEYIIEPDTDFRDVMNYFDTVHWSIERMSGLRQYIEHSNHTGQCFILFLKDNVPHIKKLKEIPNENSCTKM